MERRLLAVITTSLEDMGGSSEKIRLWPEHIWKEKLVFLTIFWLLQLEKEELIKKHITLC